jgi:hypothetical protein
VAHPFFPQWSFCQHYPTVLPQPLSALFWLPSPRALLSTNPTLKVSPSLHTRPPPPPSQCSNLCKRPPTVFPPKSLYHPFKYQNHKSLSCTERKRSEFPITAFQTFHIFSVLVNVADPDPYVFGPPGSESGSISQRYGSGSYYHQAKIVRKKPSFLLFCDFILTFYL